jgi:predicted O-methyltransferase YrrM
MSYGVAETATVLVDHEALSQLLAKCQEPGRRVALLGFNENTKHLLNLSLDSIVAVYDPEEWKLGIKFRGVSVIPADQKVDINLMVVCDFKLLYAFAGKIRRLYGGTVELFCPSRLNYQPTQDINVFKQDPVYSDIEPVLHLSPPSMMAKEKLYMLAELMRAGLKNNGDIVEMGVYQGGSVWYLAHVLKNLGETRQIFMFDVFEQHMMHPNATMSKDEISRRLAFYPHCTLLEGLVDHEPNLAQVRGRKICFGHYDLGYIPGALKFLWDHLQPGSPLVLDNYGHTAIMPWDLDDFFEARGAHVIRIPWSEQGVVFKPVV